MPALNVDPTKTALVLIDLQRAVTAHSLAPYPAAEVLARGAELAAACRARHALVVYVRVDVADMLHLPTD